MPEQRKLKNCFLQKLKTGLFSAKVEKGDPYRVMLTDQLLANQIAGKPVRISCHIIKSYDFLNSN